MIQRGVINELNGCISTGKEANVYHSTSSQSAFDLAVKVYKTSILTFKDRDKYVSGEFRLDSHRIRLTHALSFFFDDLNCCMLHVA